MKSRRVARVGLWLIIMIALFGLFSFYQQSKKTSLSASKYSALGIELRQDLGHIDLNEVENAGIKFVYLRSTQGRSYLDDDFAFYQSRVLGTKLLYGIELYYSDESAVSEQLAFFKKQVGNLTGQLPILVVPTSPISKSNQAQIKALMQGLASSYHKSVLVKCTGKEQAFFKPQVALMVQPTQGACAFWQYTTKGHVLDVPGLESQVTMYAYRFKAQESSREKDVFRSN